MSKAGGVISIIAGIFGFIAAVFTLFFGGLAGAFKTEGASTVVGLGWGGILFSFLVIVFGAIAFARPKGAGIALIVASILGAILGGTLVAVCMVLSLIGGILAVVGAKSAQSTSVPAIVAESASASKNKTLIWVSVAGVVVILVIAISAGRNSPSPNADPIASLAAAQASDIRPDGELYEIFRLGSTNTDLQRENKLKELKGAIVEWRLPVYEIKRSGSGYKIQTRSGNRTIGTFVEVTPRSDEERNLIESLKTGDAIQFKGQIAGSTLRNLEIKPAILAETSARNPNVTANTAPASKSRFDNLVGKHPTEAFLYRVFETDYNELKAQNRQSLPALSDAERYFSTASPTALVGSFIVGSGCEKSSCGESEGLFFINRNTDQIEGIIFFRKEQGRGRVMGWTKHSMTKDTISDTSKFPTAYLTEWLKDK